MEYVPHRKVDTRSDPAVSARWLHARIIETAGSPRGPRGRSWSVPTSTPGADPVDLQPPTPKEPFYGEFDVAGSTARRGLVDASRQVLAERGELDRLRKVGSDGPLAVSHVLPGGAGHRRDWILVSPDLTVVDAAYRYDEAVEAGSAHALYWADLAVRS